MENINNLSVSNITDISNNSTMYELTKSAYDDFVLEMETSHNKNGQTRYLTELLLLKRLQECLNDVTTEQEVKEISSQIDRIEEILAEQFGIKLSSKL